MGCHPRENIYKLPKSKKSFSMLQNSALKSNHLNQNKIMRLAVCLMQEMRFAIESRKV